MSRIREAHHRLLEVLRRELRREDEQVREEHDATPPNPPETGAPEIDDLPLGVPPEPAEDDEIESPGFPRGDPTHG
jgi:hypothetical protein